MGTDGSQSDGTVHFRPYSTPRRSHLHCAASHSSRQKFLNQSQKFLRSDRASALQVMRTHHNHEIKWPNQAWYIDVLQAQIGSRAASLTAMLFISISKLIKPSQLGRERADS